MMTEANKPVPAAPYCRQASASRRRRLLCVLREKNGSAAIEAAFVLPVFFVLLFGIFEFSLVLIGYCNAAYSVRMAARYASVHSSTSLAPSSSSSIQSLVQSNLFMPGSTSSSINVGYGGSGNVAGSTVNVSMAWSQAISLPGYHSTLTLATQTQRVILR